VIRRAELVLNDDCSPCVVLAENVDVEAADRDLRALVAELAELQRFSEQRQVFRLRQPWGEVVRFVWPHLPQRHGFEASELIGHSAASGN